MSIIEEALVAKLVNDATVGPLVGGKLVYPLGRTPQGVVGDHITYQRVSGKRLIAMDGPLTTQSPRIQFDCWSKVYQNAKYLAEAAAVCLHGFKGTISGFTQFNVQGIFVEEDESDSFEPPIHDSETGWERVRIEAKVWFSQ